MTSILVQDIFKRHRPWYGQKANTYMSNYGMVKKKNMLGSYF